MEVSVGQNKGTPSPKSPNVVIIKVDDLQRDVNGLFTGFPNRSVNEVESAENANILLKAGAKALAVYIAPESINRWDNTDGEGRYAGIISNFTGEHPGDSASGAQLLQEYLGEDLIVLSYECAQVDGKRLQGTPCNPMRMTFEGQDNNDGIKKTITFTQAQRDKYVMMHYKGTIPEILPYTVDEDSSASGI